MLGLNLTILYDYIIYVYKYYLQHEYEGFITYKTRRREAEGFICDKTRLTSVLNGFKNVSVTSPHWQSNFENRQRLNHRIEK